MILQVQDLAGTPDSFTPTSRLNSNTADRDLQRRVYSFLKNRNVPMSPTLVIDVRNGIVTLRGAHRSYYHKQLCINCCLRVAGVVQLIDETKVVAPRT